MSKVYHQGGIVFEVGTRVRFVSSNAVLQKGDRGTVMERSPMPYIQWDKAHPQFHDGGRKFPEGRVYAQWTDELEEVEDEDELPKGMTELGYTKGSAWPDYMI